MGAFLPPVCYFINISNPVLKLLRYSIPCSKVRPYLTVGLPLKVQSIKGRLPS